MGASSRPCLIVNKLRASLSPSNVDCLIFLQKNALQSTCSGIAQNMLVSKDNPPPLPRETVMEEELPTLPMLPCLPAGVEDEEDG